MAEDVFGASDLRRRATELLKLAQRKPVLVVSPYGAVDVVEHDRWRRAEDAETHTRTVADVLRAVAAARARSASAAYPPGLRWVRQLDDDDLSAFLNEFLGTLDALEDRRASWDDVAAVLHEWAESAAVAADAELARLLER